VIDIRQSNESDLDYIISLLTQLWPDKPIDHDRVRKICLDNLSKDNKVLLSAADENKVIGFGSMTLKISLWQEGLIGYVDELVVDSKHRGQGIGTMLLKRISEIASDKGCRRLELDSAFQRTEAHGFYETMGFENRAYLLSKKL
jgi:GNAT superfamily N-acetyltransferase